MKNADYNNLTFLFELLRVRIESECTFSQVEQMSYLDKIIY